MFRSIPYVACAMLLVTAIMAGCAAKDTYAGGHGVLSFNGGCVQQFNGYALDFNNAHELARLEAQLRHIERARLANEHHRLSASLAKQQAHFNAQLRRAQVNAFHQRQFQQRRQRLQFGGGNRSVQRSRSVIRSR